MHKLVLYTLTSKMHFNNYERFIWITGHIYSKMGVYVDKLKLGMEYKREKN